MRSKSFMILGLAVITGAIIYGIYKHRQKNNLENRDETIEDNALKDFPNINSSPIDCSVTFENDSCDTKHSVFQDIQERHNEAGDIMKEALTTIFSDDTVIETENSELLNITKNKLNDLLK